MRGGFRGRGRRERKPAKTDPASLEAAALRYLERYAASTASLRRVLVQRVRRHAPETLEAATVVIDEIVARFARARLVDDESFASMKAASLHRAGASARLIREKLAVKGVRGEVADAAIRELGDASASDLRAAIAYARRRRLGPFASGGANPDRRNRELAALGRRGFSFEIARRVIDATDVEALEAAADEN